MTVSCKFERSLINHEENEVLRLTHHPEIYDHDLDGLKALQVRLRQLRDKERTLARQKQREHRGKAEPRGGSFPGTVDQPLHRKQLFAAALKRVNRELARMEKLAARTAHVEAARRALALRRAAQFAPYPSAGETAHEGMRSLPSRRRRTSVAGAEIGRVSQATKVAQAVRDARS